MKNKHLLLDFETLGTNVFDCAVLDCSYIIFDMEKILSENPYTLNDIHLIQKRKFSVKEQVDKYSWVVYNDTIKFWELQPPEIRKQILPSKKDISVLEFTEHFISYCIDNGPVAYWWSRSNSFDPHILWRLFDSTKKSLQLKEYLPHYKLRDVRTFIDSKMDFPKVNAFVPIKDPEIWKKTFQEHNSSWDVLADLLRIQLILRAENELPI
jgi:hypothetical protein